jgi:seryl-tRNA synthetase
MLDWKRIVAEPKIFETALLHRGVASAEVSATFEKIQEISRERSKVLTQSDALKSERNTVSDMVSKLMKSGQKAEAQELIQKGKDIGTQIESLELAVRSVEDRFAKVLELIPNLPHESVPVGKSEADNPVVRSWGEKRSFAFKPLTHDVLGEKTGLLDFERAAKISGARFTFLRDGIARLERALANFMLDLHRSKGYQEIVPPYIVNAQTMYGMGQFPKFVEDVFKVEGQDKYFIPTAEVPVTSFYRDEVISEDELPVKFMSLSPCFRSEAGSYGRDTKGLIRQHQFHKVEMVKFTHPEQSLAELEGMVADAEDVLKQLKIPFRTIHLCTGDMGFNSRKTYDIEVWLPASVASEGQKEPGCYREISSCSDCGDFQARRAGIRVKHKAGKGTYFAHTLNGSGLAVGRTLVAVMENYQEADGRIRVPEVLRPYMGNLEFIEPVKKS